MTTVDTVMEQLRRWPKHGDDWFGTARSIVAAALADVRNETLEEAAKLVDEYRAEGDCACSKCQPYAVISGRVRALKGTNHG